MTLKKAGLTITLLVVASLGLGIGPAVAQQEVCGGLDSGKIDTSGNPASVTVTAPEGFLIDGYCVKAGSDESGAGVEYVTVSPPQATVTIAHPSGKAVSHYSYSLVAIQTPPTSPPPTTPPPSLETPPSETTENPPEAEVLGATAGGGPGDGNVAGVSQVPSGAVAAGGGSTAGMEGTIVFALGIVSLLAAGAVYTVRRRTSHAI